MTLRVYKSADNGNCIIELDIDTSAHTNISRTVKDKNNAKYRCDRARVVKIYNKFTEQPFISIPSDFDNGFIYHVGSIVTESAYNEDIDIVCTKGIHFYLTKNAAFHRGLADTTNYSGVHYAWYDDGHLFSKCILNNGYKDGLYESWHGNGKIRKRCIFKNGNYNGLYEEWNEDGDFIKSFKY
jgi:hypothetical protein